MGQQMVRQAVIPLAMVTWQQLEEQAPELASAGRRLWQQHGLMYLATIRTDGSPRLHPVAPILATGQIFVAVAQESPKWRDLRRDPRCVLHALPGPRDEEFALRCLAREQPEALAAVRAAAAHVIHDDDHVIGFDIEVADFGWWEHVGQPGTFSVRTRWIPQAGLRQLPGLRADSESPRDQQSRIHLLLTARMGRESQPRATGRRLASAVRFARAQAAPVGQLRDLRG
jgi:hypothetical protein